MAQEHAAGADCVGIVSISNAFLRLWCCSLARYSFVAAHLTLLGQFSRSWNSMSGVPADEASAGRAPVIVCDCNVAYEVNMIASFALVRQQVSHTREALGQSRRLSIMAREA